MVTNDQPTYMVANPETNWLGNERHMNLEDAARSAKYMTSMGGDTYYIVEIRATSEIGAHVIDLYGQVVPL